MGCRPVVPHAPAPGDAAPRGPGRPRCPLRWAAPGSARPRTSAAGGAGNVGRAPGRETAAVTGDPPLDRSARTAARATRARASAGKVAAFPRRDGTLTRAQRPRWVGRGRRGTPPGPDPRRPRTADVNWGPVPRPECPDGSPRNPGAGVGRGRVTQPGRPAPNGPGGPRTRPDAGGAHTARKERPAPPDRRRRPPPDPATVGRVAGMAPSPSPQRPRPGPGGACGGGHTAAEARHPRRGRSGGGAGDTGPAAPGRGGAVSCGRVPRPGWCPRRSPGGRGGGGAARSRSRRGRAARAGASSA